MKTIIKFITLLIFALGFGLGAKDALACTAWTSCGGCGISQTYSKDIDCSCFCQQPRPGGGEMCVDPGCHAECVLDAMGCPVGATAVCNNCAPAPPPSDPTNTPTPPPANAIPFCGGFSISGSGVTRNSDGSYNIIQGSIIKLDALGISDGDGVDDLHHVGFRYKATSNGNCAVGSEYLIGRDYSPSGGWSTQWSTSGVAVGDYHVFGLVFDDQVGCNGDPAANPSNNFCTSRGGACGLCRTVVHIVLPPALNNVPFCSGINITGVDVINAPDGSVIINSGDLVTVTALGVVDDDGEGDLSRVEFSYKNQGQQSCLAASSGEIGIDNSSSDGWCVPWSTSVVPGGDYYVFGTVFDQVSGCSGDPAATSDNNFCSAQGAACGQCYKLVHIIEEVPGSISGKVWLNTQDSTCNQGTGVARTVTIRQAGGSWTCNLTSDSQGDFTTSGFCSTDPELGKSYVISAIPRSGELVACQGSATLTTYAPDAINANVTLALEANDWFQAVEGDVHAQGNINSNVPSGQVFVEDGDLTPGVISFGGSSSGFGGGSASSTGWLSETHFSKKGFSWFYSILNSPETVNFNGTIPASGTGVEIYYARGEQTIAQPVLIGNGRQVFVLIDNDSVSNPGNLIINENIQVEVGGFLAIVVRGDVSLGSDVAELEGVFVVDGMFSTGTGSRQLNGEGMFMASSFSFQREGSASAPAEKFAFRPDFFFSFPYQYLSSSYIWEEIAP